LSVLPEYFWDSCVFIRYLIGKDSDECYDDICQFVRDAKDKKIKIHFSSLVFTEIRPRYLLQSGRKSIQDFFDDLGASFYSIDPSPNILISAAHIKDAQAVNPGDPRMPPERVRVVGTPDAIHLATCLYARDALGIADIVFHTLDAGKGPTWRGDVSPSWGMRNSIHLVIGLSMLRK
jgi:hypothetical protein